MKIIPISVGEFALPVPRVGSIESLSGYGRGAADGMEIHQRVQESRLADNSEYQSEVRMLLKLERDDYAFHVGGRIDGLYLSPPRIEEIKSSFNVKELEKKLARNPSHPYCLQLKTYGYFFWKEHGVVPKLSFHLVSSRNGASEDLPVSFDTDVYEEWMNARLDELVEEVKLAEKRVKRRKGVAVNFPFPFVNPRPKQEDLIATVQRGLEKNTRMLIQAPTGLGKTAGVLFPVLREALARGQRVVYVTPKNSQHTVAEDAVERFQESGSKVKSLTVTAKSKICFKNEPLCNPDYCEYAKDHYTKVHEAGLKEILARKRKLTSRTFRTLGEQYQVCPFELQLEGAQDADVVICDYNYVFAPRTAFGSISATAVGHTGKPSLVVDEAHNLYARAIGYYSPEVSTIALDRMKPHIEDLPSKFKSEALRLLAACRETVMACCPEGVTKRVEIDPPRELFLAQDADLRAFLSRYLESDIEIMPRDVVLRLSFYWSEFTSALDFVTIPKRKEFFTTFRPEMGGGSVRITCCDASEMLESCYDEFDQIVGFSATLKPFDYYAKLSGLVPEEVQFSEFQSPFPEKNRKVLIIPEISTKYSDRERNYGKIAGAIEKIAAVKPGNYLAFFPSFDFLERVISQFNLPPGFVLLKQQRESKAKDVEGVLQHLRNRIAPTILFAVQGGVFSEGVDYPGETVIGAFVVGPPLPPFELEREKMREYYQKHYGSGFDYTYSYPAMAKAVQAAGRVIRSETDKGIIVLMDSRFITPSYFRSMPGDWFETSPLELVSKRILGEVTEFWERD